MAALMRARPCSPLHSGFGTYQSPTIQSDPNQSKGEVVAGAGTIDGAWVILPSGAHDAVDSPGPRVLEQVPQDVSAGDARGTKQQHSAGPLGLATQAISQVDEGGAA